MSTDASENASPTAYEKLKKKFATAQRLFGIKEILVKDAETVMPRGAEQKRTQQMETLMELRHATLSAPEIGQWLDEAESGSAFLSPGDRRNLFLMRKEYTQATALSPGLVTAKASLESAGERAHDRLKPTGNWDAACPHYKESFDVNRKVGAALRARLGFASDYEALVDSQNPGISLDTIVREFTRLEEELPGMIRRARELQEQQPAPLPIEGDFPPEQQNELFRDIIGAMGFDTDHGRFDIADTHPSCTEEPPDDIRFTGGAHGNDWFNTLFDLIHEAGHGLYAQNRPKEWDDQPAGKDLGTMVHESQSMIMELDACRTIEFFRYVEKRARTIFNRPDDPALSAENLYRLKNKVTPSFIRIEADELTYPAHITLRTRLERAIIEHTLAVEDLPAAWNGGMEELLGIVPSNNSEGCMQDCHWPGGLVGYFPGYTLGAMIAAQLFAAACRARPDLCDELANGNFAPLREWLHDNVHSKGSLLTVDELMIAATGEKLNAKYYLDHLSRRFLGTPWQPQPERSVSSPAPGAGPR